ncbi:hypothetical protein HR060_06710 [Catenovulum sp. SM1970]|uniref:hypothetical protein n=1 Tax=Marinifaba aquimaris TaxID=2741323 RepID=UPI001573E21A|nr:hypothetical protein [Marinifaba aquimaris]NTS76558.1 hypothetical protein [Marinifaba aquimaris]
MDSITFLSRQIITLYQQHLKQIGLNAAIHFEFEGGFSAPLRQSDMQHHGLNYAKVNAALKKHGIAGELKPEFWRNQWEYVSLFNGQTPLEEAEYLAKTLTLLPHLFAEQGIAKVYYQPVLWSADSVRMAAGTKDIFAPQKQAVHIPNAVQINISVWDKHNNNLVAETELGEYLQHCLLSTSLNNCLLYLPEEDAFKRLNLKSDFDLESELSSPNDISGGHQGSVALYRQLGKHNQVLGEKALLADCNGNVLLSEFAWQKTARIEHRLGASSHLYNPFLNMVYALANVVNAIKPFINHLGQFDKRIKPEYEAFTPVLLPTSLNDSGEKKGAISLFASDVWLVESIHQLVSQVEHNKAHLQLGEKLKSAVLAQYQKNIII